jgi:hydroxyacylglutathione hydrolase
VIKRIPAGVYAANCYVVMDEETKQAVILDPGGDSEDIIKGIEALSAEVKLILLTHGHVDHVGAVEELREKYNVPVYINKKDEDIINKGDFIFGKLTSTDKPSSYISEGDELRIGELVVKCIETPGHTPGGMSFLIGDNLFTGDTLFAGSIGRTDFTGGDFDTLIHSIKTKLLVMKDDVKVFSGHGPQSTIGRERQTNPFL